MIKNLNIKKIIFSTDDGFTCIKPEEYKTTHVSQGNRFIRNLKLS